MFVILSKLLYIAANCGSLTCVTTSMSKGTRVAEDTLVLLSRNRQPVGLGKICPEQEIIHGHIIPHGYVKVIIEYIKPNIRPPFPMAFDDEDDEIHFGQFLIWPKQYTTSAAYS